MLPNLLSARRGLSKLHIGTRPLPVKSKPLLFVRWNSTSNDVPTPAPTDSTPVATDSSPLTLTEFETGTTFSEKLITYQQLWHGDLSWYMYPIKSFEFGVEALHASTSLEWWGIILLSAVILRVVLFPVQIRMTRFGTRMNHLSAVIKEKSEAVRARAEARRQRGLPMEVSPMSAMAEIYKEHGINPRQSMIYAFIQFPVFFLLLVSLRDMCTDPVFYETFSQGGFSWFTDLTKPDTTWGTPALVGLSTIMVMETQPKTTGQEPGIVMKGFFRASALLIAYLSTLQPAGVALYWIASSFVTAVANLFLCSKKVRKAFNIPLVKEELLPVAVSEKKDIAPETLSPKKFKKNK